LHDNGPAHRARATRKKLAYLGFQCLYRLHYYLDLAPSDYHLFPGLGKKKQLKDQHFSSDAEVIAAAETWLDGHTSEFFFFLSGLQNLEHRAKKCIEIRAIRTAVTITT